MINSFWNICSTCPMPKEEKLNSEYKRNYVWHPQYKPLAQDVISCAPQSIAKEMGIQRRKQYPDLAYRSHEVIRHDLGQHSKDSADLRARSEERDAGQVSKSGPRSRSAEPGMGHQQQNVMMIQSFPPIASSRVSMLPNTEEFPNIAEQPSETSEYQSQYAWPKKGIEDAPCMARKSVSMNIIKGSDETDMLVPKTKLAPVHRPCVKHREETNADKPTKDSRKFKTEYKAKYKPFTSYVYVDGQWKKTSRLVKVPEKENDHLEEPWLVEVVERLQKANEYRWRGHGHPVYGELLPEAHKKHPEGPTPRPKVVAPEHLINQPKCHQSASKRSDPSKKEMVLEPISEKKKERKTSPQLRRPKSAEPAKAKETVKQKRPATTPPAKPVTRTLSTRKRTPKDEDSEKILKGRTPSIRKAKEPTAKTTPSSGKKTQSPYSTSHSSGGKVWLQADKSAPEPKPEDKPLVPETSDAVRPSSLSPMPAKSVPEEPASEKLEPAEGKEISGEEIKSTVSQSSVVPLTHVRTPEEVTGVKSPDPENWTVPLESSERLQWSGVNTVEKESSVDNEPSLETTEPTDEISEKLSTLAAAEEPVPSPLTSQEESNIPKSSSSKLTSANVLDRARSRLDQFWGKNK